MSTRPEGPRTPVVLTDTELSGLLDPRSAVAWMTEALLERSSGSLRSPARIRANLGAGAALIVTAGIGDRWYGLRSYDIGLDGEQAVLCFDRPSGRLLGIAVGDALGAARTGALGGVAMRAITGGRVSTVAVIGSGRQAAAQLWALSAFATPDRVRVHARNPERRAAFAARIRAEHGWQVEAVASARSAVTGADLVILATSSPTPVIATQWLDPDVRVVTLGPKQVERAEFEADLLEGAALLCTDSPEQLAGYEPPAIAADLTAMHDLADVVAGTVPVPRTGRVVHCSVGLAGTEPYLLGHLLASMHR